MKKPIVIAAISTFLFAGCAVGLNRHGDWVVVPALPVTVELDADQYYYQNGYYYHHNRNAWFYSESRQGPWRNLPRSHYPKEVRYKRLGGNDRDDRYDRDNRDYRDHDDREHDR